MDKLKLRLQRRCLSLARRRYHTSKIIPIADSDQPSKESYPKTQSALESLSTIHENRRKGIVRIYSVVSFALPVTVSATIC